MTATLVYTYTADGLRVAQSVNGVVTSFVWDWAVPVVPELLSSGVTRYLLGAETLGQWDGAAWTYVMPDALGSVRQTVDRAGTVTADREWSPYGVEVGGAQAGLGYTGEWQAADVGLVYLRARWYQAETGRFTQVDPWEGDIWEPLSLNDYSYTRADPLNRVDPSGTMDMLTWYKAILPGVKFSSCSTNDYQPFAYLNIFMGHEEADTHYQLNQGATAQAWNQAPGGMLRALKRAVDGMVALLGPAFGRRMGEAINTHKVILVYDPLNGNPDELAYIYPPTANWAGVSVDSNRMNVNTAAGEFLGHAKFNPTPEDRMTAGFAHEFTHLVSRIVDGPEGGQAICVSYCNQILGYIDGWWVPYPAGSRGTACQQSTGAWSAPWEAVANLVGIYVAQPTIYDQPHPVLAPGKNIDLSYLRDFILQEFVPHMQ